MTAGATDVLVVGGGIIGLTCAHFLLESGRSVRVLDMDRVGSGCSGGNCGLITPSHAAPLTAPGMIGTALHSIGARGAPLYVKPTLRLSTLRWLVRFASKCNARHMRRAAVARAALLNSSRCLYDTLIADNELQCDWVTDGVLALYQSAAALHAAESANEILSELGISSTPYHGTDLLDLEPALRSGLYGRLHTSDAQVRPERLVAEVERLVRQRGAPIVERCAVVEFATGVGGIEGVETRDGSYRAAAIVLAAGAWTPTLARHLGIRLPIEPGKGYSITIADQNTIRPTRACILHDRSIGVTPWTGGYRLGGTMEFSGFQPELTRSRLDSILAGAREYFRGLPSRVDGLDVWCGWRPMTPDELPFIGELPLHRNVFVAAGHGMMGVSMAPATGRLVAEIITGAAPHIDPTPYRVARS